MTPSFPASPPRHHTWVWIFLAVFLLVIGIAALFVTFFGHAYLKKWIESPEGQRLASQGIGKVIKVDGAFAPLHLDGWTLQTDGFQSKGWPGEAIGAFDATNIRAELDPAAIWYRAWRIKSINVDRATIQLLPPNDALKRPVPPKAPRPWYAFLLPNRFECGPIITPNATLRYSFQGQMARIHDAHVEADLIGKDLKYTATSGVLEMPYFPPLRIERLEMLVTRPFIKVYTAQLAGLDPADTARVNLSGTIGMRENKEIEATGDVIDIPIEQILPENLRPLIHGRASGHLVWHRDATGKVLDSDGDLTMIQAGIDDISVFKQLALLDDNPDLKDFTFDQATCTFHLHQGRMELEVQVRAPNRFTLSGKVAYQLDSKFADLDVALTDLPLQTWLPPEFKAGAAGSAEAKLQWHGQLETIKDSTGKVSLVLDGGTLATPTLLRHMMASKRLRSPSVIQFKTAQFDFAYNEQTFELTRGDLDLPGIVTAHLQGELAPDRNLKAQIAWTGLTLADWLPPDLAEEFSGDIAGRAQIEMKEWKMENGSYGGQLRLLHGQLNYTPFQSLLARFVGDRALLTLPLTRAGFSWNWESGNLGVHAIDLRSGDRFAVAGDFAVAADKNLSGVVWIGTRPSYLNSLSGLGDAIFSPGGDGLSWARVRLSGTIKKPQQDLSTQIIGQLGHHPLAIFGLGAKLTSWYVGNWFGEKENWARPDVEVGPVK